MKFKHSVFQSRICDDISPAISPYKLSHTLLKNLTLLACERNLQEFSLSHKIGVIPQIHSTSHGHVLFLFLVVLFFFEVFFLLKKKSKNIENFQKEEKYFILYLVLFFLEDYMNYDISLDLEHA